MHTGVTWNKDESGALWSILFQLIAVGSQMSSKSHLEDVGPSVITQNKIGFPPNACKLPGRRGGRGSGKTPVT